MELNAFLDSCPPEEKAGFYSEIELGASYCMIGNSPVIFHGRLPSAGKSVLLASFSCMSRSIATSFFVSAFEAALSRIDVITKADGDGMSSVLCGTECGCGRLHVIATSGLADFRRRFPERMARILRTGGSVAALSPYGERRRDCLMLAQHLASSALFAAGNEVSDSQHPIFSMLDDGKEIALLRSALEHPLSRRLASSGCPVTDSFSSFVSFPSHIVYPCEAGRFFFLGTRYGFMSLC